MDLGAVNRRMIESLIKAGAMDSLEGTRAQKFAAVEGAMEAGTRAQRDRESGQAGLFGEMLDASEPHAHPLPKVPDWTDKEKLAGEKEIARLLRHRPSAGSATWTRWRSWRRTTARTLEGLAKSAEVALCGVLTGITRKRNKEGKPWAAMQIEDRTGVDRGDGVRDQLRAAGDARWWKIRRC